jgi:hypothetical protein
MDREARQAQAYERRYPDTGCSEAQKAERMDRLDIDEGRGRAAGFAGGTNMFSVPPNLNLPGSRDRKPTPGGYDGKLDAGARKRESERQAREQAARLEATG